jgi:hypothetical protein
LDLPPAAVIEKWQTATPGRKGRTGNSETGGRAVKLYVDTSSKQVTVSREPVEKTDQNGRQKVERGTGRPMWSTQVFVLDEDGGEVITVTTAGERPSVRVGQPVSLSKLEALPWATNGRNGVAFRATELKATEALKAIRPASGS